MVELPPWKIWRPDVSSVNLSSERITKGWRSRWQLFKSFTVRANHQNVNFVIFLWYSNLTFNNFFDYNSTFFLISTDAVPQFFCKVNLSQLMEGLLLPINEKGNAIVNFKPLLNVSLYAVFFFFLSQNQELGISSVWRMVSVLALEDKVGRSVARLKLRVRNKIII